jgi:branched-subunit amino acid aminotransferase/4-amino-4-deoxychorismate lyase
MIWVAGQIVRDDEVSVSVLDRTFEHGLGLFETFRTWNGHATLLPRHLERLQNAAADLGLPVPEPWQLPLEKDVHALLSADERSGDALLRITMSGGIPGSPTGATVWMRSAALPEPKPTGYRIGAMWKVRSEGPTENRTRPLSRYKSLNYWERRNVHQAAVDRGWDENLAIDDDGFLQEGSRTNLFLVSEGRLFTPSLECGIVPGIMRRVALEFAEPAGLGFADSASRGLPVDALRAADEVFLTNSVRGVLPVAELRQGEEGDEDIPDRTVRYPSPGPWTLRLWNLIRPWLESGGNPK